MLDGFPRTIEQAKALDKLTEIDIVINIVVDFDLIIDRITGRRMCACGATYHITTYSSDTCKACGGKLYQRKDDTVETVANRLEVYNKQTAPLIEYYKNKGILKDVNGSISIQATFEQVQKLCFTIKSSEQIEKMKK